MRHGSLFSGIGGFDWAAEQIGWENIFSCEINPFGRKVLEYYWPKANHYEDITTTDFTIYRGRVDVLSGGFPCQDASIAKQNGGGEGLDGARTGLWREMVRAIDEVEPRYIVAENVENILRTNDGRDFAAILGALDGMGYNAEWRVCRASEVGACHHRARCYLVAYPGSVRLEEGESFFTALLKETESQRRFIAGTTASVGVSWEAEPSVSWVDDGLPGELDGITLSKWSKESIKALGNAIVPQVAYEIFKAIDQIDQSDN